MTCRLIFPSLWISAVFTRSFGEFLNLAGLGCTPLYLQKLDDYSPPGVRFKFLRFFNWSRFKSCYEGPMVLSISTRWYFILPSQAHFRVVSSYPPSILSLIPSPPIFSVLDLFPSYYSLRDAPEPTYMWNARNFSDTEVQRRRRRRILGWNP